MTSYVWVAEVRTEEDPSAEWPQIDVINKLLDHARLTNPAFDIRLVEGEGSEGEMRGLLLTHYDPPSWRFYEVDELTSESPWYEQANKILRSLGKNWRFRLPANNQENPYEVALRLYRFSSPELNNDSLLEEEDKPRAKAPARKSHTWSDPLQEKRHPAVPGDATPDLPQVPRSPVPPIGVPALLADRGDWQDDQFQGAGAPDLLDFLYKDFLTLYDPGFAVRLEEHQVGVEDFGDSNYVRMAAIGRILGWVADPMIGGDEIIDQAKALATRLGLMEPPS